MGNTKKKPSLSKAILNLIILIPTLFSILGKVTALIEFEAHMAGKNLIRLIVLSVAFGALLTATWVGILAILFTYLQSLSWAPLVSLSLILFLNIFVLIIIGFCLCNAKKNISFPEMRNQLRHLKKLFQD